MVIIRVIVSLFWYGIGTYTGAECVRSIIYTWSPSFRHIPNSLPASANIDTGFMICYFVYFLLVLPFHYIPTHRLHWIFLAKAIACPVAGFAIVGWVIQSTGGGDQVFQFGNEYRGARLGWAFISGVNAMIGNFATLAVNMNDFARYSRNPRSPYVQLVVIPVAFMVMMLFGIIGANGSRILYGEVLCEFSSPNTRTKTRQENFASWRASPAIERITDFRRYFASRGPNAHHRQLEVTRRPCRGLLHRPRVLTCQHCHQPLRQQRFGRRRSLDAVSALSQSPPSAIRLRIRGRMGTHALEYPRVRRVSSDIHERVYVVGLSSLLVLSPVSASPSCARQDPDALHRLNLARPRLRHPAVRLLARPPPAHQHP